MLELRTYTSEELSQILNSTGNQAMERKMESWGITFTSDNGRGRNKNYTITDIKSPFKVYCITELGIDPRTDFYKLRNCFYYFLNDPEFREAPDEMKSAIAKKNHRNISRQTITKYIQKLSKNEFVLLDSRDYNYYFAYGKFREYTDEKTYKKAWQLYWDTKEEIKEIGEELNPMDRVIYKYGGVPRKQAKPEFNVFYLNEIQFLNDLVCAEIEREVNFKSEY